MLEEIYKKHTMQEPLMVKIGAEDRKKYSRFVKTEDSIYKSKKDLGTNETIILCAGSIQYDSELGNKAKFDEYYNFRPKVELMKKCLNKADLAIGNFAAMASEEYLSTEMMSEKYNPNKYYSNARVEYLKALKYAGFDLLALANPNNLDAGVSGIGRTIANIEKEGMLSVGAGTEKAKIFHSNGIQIGVLSYTVECALTEKLITEEGKNLLLNIYEEEKAKADIQNLRDLGAEFVLVYVNCGGKENKTELDGRKQIGKEIAEAGADYVICTVPDEISEYFKYKTTTGRTVPVATSLGNFLCGKPNGKKSLGAIVQITIYKLLDGTLDVSDAYIPVKQFEELDGYNLPVVPAVKAFYPDYKLSMFKEIKSQIKKSLGNQIDLVTDRVVSISELSQPQLTFEEVYDSLGVKPSFFDRRRLDMKKKATVLAARRAELKKGCVAILVKHYGYKGPEFQITMEDAIKAGASLIIAPEKCKDIPTIVIPLKQMRKELNKLYDAVVSKYHPITVAITGTAGKTTTKELTSCVFDTHYNTLHVEGNYNQYFTCTAIIQKLTSKFEAYIQEVHGGEPNSAHRVSCLIKPDIAIITNIGDGHLMNMGTIENVVKGKLELADGLKPNGVLIVNNDNEHLKDLQMEGKRIIHYSTFDTNCEYYAQNINDMGDKVEFQVVCEKGTFDLVLNMQGLHNVGNAIAVFAAATEAGIPYHKIKAGLTHYVPDADKQNLLTFNGYNMLVDTYSATPISVESAMQTLSDFPVAEGARKIAVLGDIPALGDSSEEKHIELGERLVQYNFDVMLCVGTDSKHFALAAQKAGKEAYTYEDREAFNRKLAECIKPGDFILFKSGTRSHLKEETIYPLFGLIDKN